MRILYTNFHPGDGGGHTTYILALARALGAQHEVHIAAPAGSKLLHEAAQIPTVRALAQSFPGGLRMIAARRALSAYLRKHAFDVVHVNGSADHRLAMAAVRKLSPRPAIVFTKHNSKPMRSLGNGWRARRGTDLVIAVSAHTERMLRRSPYRHCRLAMVRNGVDLSRYAPWPCERAATERARWTADPSTLLIGSHAGTAPYKGWLDLIEALGTLPPDARARIHVLLAGNPPTAMQRARIEALGLAAQVSFTGMLDDVRPMIACIEAGFVLSYEVETISFACREMMAMGKPVLLTDYAGLPENITPGRDGWKVPVRDHAAIARVLLEMLKQRETLPAMGAAAHARAQAEFGIERFAADTLAAYRQALSPSLVAAYANTFPSY